MRAAFDSTPGWHRPLGTIPRPKLWLALCVVGTVGMLKPLGAAAEHAMPEANGQEEVVSPAVLNGDQVVRFPAAFFSRYQPHTALDMVLQVPGFQLDGGGSARGFAGAAGNVRINNRLTSSKERPNNVLERIPASHVERIELVRTSMRGIDLLGHSVVANVILREDAPVAVRWEAQVRRTFDHGPVTPRLTLALADRWAGIQYHAGLIAGRSDGGREGSEYVFDGTSAELTEERFDERTDSGRDINGTFNATTWWGDTLVQLNGDLFVSRNDTLLTSARIPHTGGDEPREELFDEGDKRQRFEIAADAERSLHRDLLGKIILLHRRTDTDSASAQESLDAQGEQTRLRVADTDRVNMESIARLEFDWIGWDDHAVQLGIEGARNVLDSALNLTVDHMDGAGPVQEFVPGGNTRVEEVRGDVLLRDVWSLGRFDIDYGLGAELSRMSQSGDAQRERRFFFLKPHWTLTHTPGGREHTRLRLAREVSQLNFSDFVSATVFEDDDLALGNPDLRPETTWVAELNHERRFAELVLVNATVFHHWINDVEDLLPLTSTFEAPGNIGDGRRWGMVVETRVPLDGLGLTGARVDTHTRWQNSRVVDPVTGQKRGLSGSPGNSHEIPLGGENRYAFSIGYRQDLEAVGMAWGLELRRRGERPRYKVNELDLNNEGTGLNGFVETTRWRGMRMHLDVRNLFDYKDHRQRTVFAGERDRSAEAFREERFRTRGRQVLLSLSGTF